MPAEPTSIPISEDARRYVEAEAAKRGVPVQAYMEEVLGLRGRSRLRSGGDGMGRGSNIREYMDSMRDFAELAPTLLMMRAMGMSGGNLMPTDNDGIKKSDLLELVAALKGRGGDDDDDDPIGRKMEKMAMRRMNYRLYAQMLGDDTTEGKAAAKMAEKYDAEIRELRKAYEETKEKTAEQLEREKEERYKAELAARDRELQAVRDDMMRLQEQINAKSETPAPWEQMREMASSLIAAKEAWSNVEQSFRGPPPSPSKEAPLVEKLGHVLDRGASAAKDFLVGMGALQAGQRGVPPTEIGTVPPPPIPSPMPAAPPAPQPAPAAAPPPPPPAAQPPAPATPPSGGVASLISAPPEEATPVYYDGEGNPISPAEFAAQATENKEA